MDFKVSRALEEDGAEFLIKSEDDLRGGSSPFSDNLNGGGGRDEVTLTDAQATVEGESLNTWLARLNHQQQEHQIDDKANIECSPTNFARHIQETSLIPSPISPPPPISTSTPSTQFPSESKYSHLTNQLNRNSTTLHTLQNLQPQQTVRVGVSPQFPVIGNSRTNSNGRFIQQQQVQQQQIQPSSHLRNTIVFPQPSLPVTHPKRQSTSSNNPSLPSFDASFSSGNIVLDKAVTVSFTSPGATVTRPPAPAVMAGNGQPVSVYGRRPDNFFHTGHYVLNCKLNNIFVSLSKLNANAIYQLSFFMSFIALYHHVSLHSPNASHLSSPNTSAPHFPGCWRPFLSCFVEVL